MLVSKSRLVHTIKSQNKESVMKLRNAEIWKLYVAPPPLSSSVADNVDEFKKAGTTLSFNLVHCDISPIILIEFMQKAYAYFIINYSRANGRAPTTPTLVGPNILPLQSLQLYFQKFGQTNNYVVEVFLK